MNEREEKLQFIADVLQSWIDYDVKDREKEGLETMDDTKIRCFPKDPSHGVLKNWIKVLRERR